MAIIQLKKAKRPTAIRLADAGFLLGTAIAAIDVIRRYLTNEPIYQSGDDFILNMLDLTWPVYLSTAVGYAAGRIYDRCSARNQQTSSDATTGRKYRNRLS